MAAALLSGAAITAAAPAGAQQNSDEPPVSVILRDDGTPMQLSARRNGFNLFAEEDLAGNSLRLSGRYEYPFVNAGGLCPFARTGGDIFNTDCGNYGGSTFFHATAVWGVGIDDYRKIRDVHPGVAQMLPPVGYSTPWRITSIAPITVRIGPADGQFGRYFSGAVSEDGAGCRDFSGANGHRLPDNFTLTASSDCEETWSSNGFEGVHVITDEQWLAKFQANPMQFTWDSHKMVPEPDAPVLGNVATYGAFSDFPREVVQLYGGVTPRGAGPARERGFPIGIEVRVDAWKFDRPSIQDGVFIRWLVINRSDQVWGQGIDYDKLHMGVDPGYILSGQRGNAHHIVSRGVHVASGGGWSERCSATYPRRIQPGADTGCDGSRTTDPRFIMILKSPLGDLKNKMFSDPSSPYYAPTHPDADDTITFNHWRRGGFGAQEQFSWRRSDRALYGLLAGDEELWLDGRSALDFSADNIWDYFMYEFTDGQQNADNLRYNRSVPGDIPGYGKWDYNDDGIQDTLKIPDCGQFGCSNPWADTIAGGFSSFQFGNIGNFLGFGPFALAAGDTTEILWFMGGSQDDTLAFNRIIDNVTQTYFKNFAGAAQYPTPVITSNDVQIESAWFRDSTVGNQNTSVRIQVKMPPRADDVFLKSVLARIEGNDPEAVELRRLNPGLADVVRGRMRQNLAEVLVFKSCDAGVTWSSASDCTQAVENYQTQDQQGAPIGLGWRPRFRLTADTITGELSANVVSESVQSGREYLYSFVTKTRSLADIDVVLSETMDAAGNVTERATGTLTDALGVDIDTIVSALKVTGASTISVYAPISVPSGTIYARLDSARTQGMDVTNRVVPVARSTTIEGTYRMRFGNRFVITRTLDTATGARTSTVIRQSVYENAATSATGTVMPDFVAAADTFASNTDFTYESPSDLELSTTPASTVGSVQTFVDTISAPGYVLAQGSGGTQPYFVAISNDDFTGGDFAQSTAEFEGAGHYPGFNVTVQNETAPPGVRLSRVIGADGDTLHAGVINSFGVVYQTASSASEMYSPGGFYKLRWQGDAFGPSGGSFRLGTVEEMLPTWNASLAARPTASTARVDESLRALDNFPSQSRPMIAAKLPFQVLGISGQPADVVMLQRHTTGDVTDSLVANSVLIGTTGDTVRLPVPADYWMPGDTLYVIERIMTDSTITVGGETVVVVANQTINGRTQQLPIQVEREIVGLKMTLSCAAGGSPSRITCNPLALNTTGATGYRPYENGFESVWLMNRLFDQNSEITLTAAPLVASGLPLTKRDMNNVAVVPNPFIVQSGYDRLTSGRAVAESRIRFVNVPKEGLLRIYSISGQLMQQLSWTQEDLVVSATGSPHGDLPYNLRTREGLDLGPGLYVYVMTARGENANGQVARGKFVIIR